MALTLHSDFLNNPSLTGHNAGPDYSITRATKATMVDADGYIREVQSGEARFTGATFRHNLLLQSEEFDTSWINVRSTETSGKADPNGGTDGWALNEDGTAANTHGLRQSAIEYKGLTIVSVYVKASNRTWAALHVPDSAGTARFVYFNLSTGVVGTGHPNFDNWDISDEGGGWYRIWVETSYIGSANLTIHASDGDVGSSYDGLSQESILVYGAQAEYRPGETNPSPSTYIPTTTTAVSSLTGTSTKGLLVEEARTNIIVQSEDFSTTWTAEDLTVTTNQIASPDGSTTADLLTENTATADHRVYSNGATTSAGATVTLSVFLKDGDRQYTNIAINNAGNYVYATVDLQNGTITETGAAGTGTYAASTIESYGNGWYRASVTGDLGVGVSLVYSIINLSNSATPGQANISYLGTSKTIYVWGAQLEAGAFPTSYIATTTASVTRNAETVDSSDMSWLASDENIGSWYVRAYAHGGIGTTLTTDPAPVAAFQGGANLIVPFQILNESSDLRIYALGGAAGAAGSVGTITANTEFKAAVGFAKNDVASYFNGVAGDTDNTFDRTGATALDSLRVGYRNGQWNSHIAEIRYYDERYDNGTLLLMSQGIFPTFGLSFVRDIVRSLVRDLVTDLVR